MEYSFLVDVNLPKFFSFFNKPNFYFVSDLNLKMSDTEIWNYALAENHVILTKDTDFYNRILVVKNSPKIIYFQLGNCSLKQLNDYFELNWSRIISELNNAKLIVAKKSHIEILR